MVAGVFVKSKRERTREKERVNEIGSSQKNEIRQRQGATKSAGMK